MTAISVSSTAGIIEQPGSLSIQSFAQGGRGAFDHTDMSYADRSYTQLRLAANNNKHQ